MALSESQLEAKIKKLEIQLAQHKHTWAWYWWPRIDVWKLKWFSDKYAKVSSTDTNPWFLNDKITVWSWITKSISNSWSDEKLQFNWELIFWWNWSDWALTITSWQTVTLTASSSIQIKNYSSIDIQSWWILNIQTTNTAPVILKSSGTCTIAWTINFNSTYNSTTVYPPFLLATWTTFTPTWQQNTTNWWTDLIINCVWDLNCNWWIIDLWATSPATTWVLRMITKWTYTSWTYTASSTTVIEKPTIF